MRDLTDAEFRFRSQSFEPEGLVWIDQKHPDNSPRSAGKDIFDSLRILECGRGPDNIHVDVMVDESECSIQVDVSDAQFLTSGLYGIRNIGSGDHGVEIFVYTGSVKLITVTQELVNDSFKGHGSQS